MDTLREAADHLRDKLGSGVVVLGSIIEGEPKLVAMVTQDIIARGISAGEIIGKIAPEIGGKGGGRPNMALGGGKDPSGLDRALEMVYDVIGQTRRQQWQITAQRGPRAHGPMTEKQETTPPPNIVYFTNRDDWRAWLQSNHATEPDVWLTMYKKHTKQPCVSYSDAVEEALCFGWIDSAMKPLDADRHIQRFSPRKPKSNWSDSTKSESAS